MNLVEVALMDVCRKKNVNGLALTHKWRTISCMLDYPTLIQFKGSFEYSLFFIGKKIEVLDGPFRDGNI